MIAVAALFYGGIAPSSPYSVGSGRIYIAKKFDYSSIIWVQLETSFDLKQILAKKA